LVVETALEGDKIAIEILKQAGFELGLAAVAVIKKLDLAKRKIPIGCVGSVFRAGELLTEPMLKTIRTIAPKAFLTEPKMLPSEAAALMALRNGKNGGKR
jgi:N-acetylglucosamine kinase-like BadF-type ATPase